MNSAEPNPAAAGLDISGVVVHVDPLRASAARVALEAIPGVTVHAVSPEGKLVATLETASEALSAALCERIQALPQVQAVAMAYHQLENDPDQEV